MKYSKDVSIQLITPASGDSFDVDGWLEELATGAVSIQLITPASGDLRHTLSHSVPNIGFHSTNYPSEWGHCPPDITQADSWSFHSTNYPSEWGLGGQ